MSTKSVQVQTNFLSPHPHNRRNRTEPPLAGVAGHGHPNKTKTGPLIPLNILPSVSLPAFPILPGLSFISIPAPTEFAERPGPKTQAAKDKAKLLQNGGPTFAPPPSRSYTPSRNPAFHRQRRRLRDNTTNRQRQARRHDGRLARRQAIGPLPLPLP